MPRWVVRSSVLTSRASLIPLSGLTAEQEAGTLCLILRFLSSKCHVATHLGVARHVCAPPREEEASLLTVFAALSQPHHITWYLSVSPVRMGFP